MYSEKEIGWLFYIKEVLILGLLIFISIML